MAERGIRPEDALSCDALSRLSEVHCDRTTQKVPDPVAVRVRRDPARSSHGRASQDEGWEVEEGDAVEVGGEETDDVLLEADEDDTRYCTLNFRDGVRSLGDTSVWVWAGVFLVIVLVCMRSASMFLWRGPFLHMRVLRRHSERISCLHPPFLSMIPQQK